MFSKGLQTNKEKLLELLVSLIEGDSSADATIEGINQKGETLSYGLICTSPFDRNNGLPQLILFGSYDKDYIKSLVVDNESKIKPFLENCLDDLDMTITKIS